MSDPISERNSRNVRDGACHMTLRVLHSKPCARCDDDLMMTAATDDIDRTTKHYIGRRIRERREELGLSQWDLAMRLEIRQDEVSRWENGRVHPRGDNLRRIAAVLDVDWRVLLTPYPAGQ